MKLSPRYFTLLAVCVPLQGAFGYEPGSKVIIGAVETVAVYRLDYRLNARIDTGATHSSLHAEQIEVFVDSGNRKRVRFGVRDAGGFIRNFSLPLHRTAHIRRHDGKRESRPVVKLGLCLGKVYQEVETTLVDRTGLTYPLLIGRSFLSGRFLVDVSLQHTQDIACELEVGRGAEPADHDRSHTTGQKQPRDHQ